MAKKKKQFLPLQKKLNLTYYTEDSYFQVFPYATDDDYFNYLLNDEFELLKQAEKNTGYKISHIRQVVIAEEYFQWLEKEGKENTTENRTLYMGTLSDSEVEKLWEKHLVVDFTVMIEAFPFIVMSAEDHVVPAHSFKISEENIVRFKNLIANSWNIDKNQVLIHPELIRGDSFFNEFEEEFHAAAHNYFVTGNYEMPEELTVDLQVQKNVNLAYRFLAFAVRDEDKAIVSRKELEKESKRTYEISERSMESISAEIQKEVPFETARLSGFGFSLSVEEVPGFIEDFNESLTKAYAEKGIDSELI